MRSEKMMKVIDCRKVSDEVDSYYTNVYLTSDNKEVVFIEGEGYFYLNKAGLKITKKKLKMPSKQ
jgi:hypothetical protein